MGLRGLEQFIATSGKFPKIKILEEIAKWKQEHGFAPTILFDGNGLTKVVAKINDNLIIYGGEFDKYYQLIEYLFKKLHRTGAKLVFFVRYGARHVEHLEQATEYIHDTIDRFKPAILAINDCKSVEIGNAREAKLASGNDKRFFHNIIELCQKYGEIVVVSDYYTQTIVRYARDHADQVLSIIGYDTKLLAYDGTFEYWCKLDSIEAISNLSAFRVERLRVMELLNLSHTQMRLHAIITNTYNEIVINFAFNPIFYECTEKSLLFRFAWYIQRTFPNDTDVDLECIARDIYGAAYDRDEHLTKFQLYWTRLDSELNPNVENQEQEQRLIDAVDDPGYAEIADVCRTKNLLFVYCKILEPTNIPIIFWPLTYLDFRQERSVQFNNSVNDVLIKLVGIVHKDRMVKKRPATMTMFTRTLNDEQIECQPRAIIFPDADEHSISFKNVIIDEDDEQYDEDRWRLLAWAVGLDADYLAVLRSSSNASKIRVVAMTLRFLLLNNLIDLREARAILRTETNTRSVRIPSNCPPPIIKERAPQRVSAELVQTAHIYSGAYLLVLMALEVCGLSKEKDLIQFNAFDFYDLIEENNTRPLPIERIIFPDEE